MSIKITADTIVPEHVLADPRVKKCAGTCGRWTRNTAMSLADFPGTVARSYEDMCQKCNNDVRRTDRPVVRKAEDNLKHTVTALDNWMARRRVRKSRMS